MRPLLPLFLLLLSACVPHPPQTTTAPVPVATNPDADYDELRDYIRRSWSFLARGPAQLLQAANDPMFAHERLILYIPADEDMARIRVKLGAETPAADLARIDIRTLPADIAHAEPGLLYLPEPYVVPGGRFNAMYGWDSYFILLGLLRDNRVVQARQLVDDLAYEVAHYGALLNANRSNFLERSQPPLLAPMIRRVYEVTHDKAWLASVTPALVANHRYFTTGEHNMQEVMLSRYHAGGQGPAPEVVSGERDGKGLSHYDRVKAVFRVRVVNEPELRAYYDAARDELTDLFYVADRSMRESGFDPTDRFGPFGSGILDLAPVCLNSLLYLTERDLMFIMAELDRLQEAQAYAIRAKLRQETVEHLLWDEASGLYLDYDVPRRQRRNYPFLTTFLPLWVGLASPEHAARLVAQLPRFERQGGLLTSDHLSGSQWDAPFGWAPLELFAIEGMRRYHHDADADRVAVAFLSMIARDFHEHHAIFEKYDVERGRSTAAAGLRFGYQSNEIGFGWTNGVFLELYAHLREPERKRVRAAASGR